MMGFQKPVVQVNMLAQLHERETGLFLACFNTGGGNVENATVSLRTAWGEAKEAQQEELERVINELATTFKRGQILRLLYLDGHEEYVTFQYASGWHIYSTSNGCSVGHPLVMLIQAEAANEVWVS